MLKDRLRLLRKEGSHRKSRPPRRTELLPGWEQKGEFTCLRETVRRLLPEEVRLLSFASETFGHLNPADGLRWFDTETTGLSGGAGTIAFLYGQAEIREGELVLRQLFLSDFPGEPEFLEEVQRLADFNNPERLFISYNGKTYDTPLLRSRFIMNRMQAVYPSQLDLLHLSRRLWKKTLPNCSLRSVEEGILGILRKDDLPGAFAPQAYFDYLSGRDVKSVLRVVEHNEMDLISLVFLFGYLGQVIRTPRLEKSAPPGAIGVMSAELYPEIGIPFLSEAAENGDKTALVWLSKKFKREGDWAAAENLWKRQEKQDPYSMLELAKYWEHRKLDLLSALEITEALLAGCGSEAERISLEKRSARLRAKIRRQRPRPRKDAG